MASVNGVNGHQRRPDQVRTTLAPIGEIIDTSVADFAAQACEFGTAPPFGSFVKVSLPERTLYGIVFAIHSGSLDPGGRAVMRGRDGQRDQQIYEANPDLQQVLRTEFTALTLGFDEGGRRRAYLPPAPPPLHWSVYECSDAETARLTDSFDYFRTVLAAPEVPADALLAANVRLAGRARGDDRAFAVRAGRELATLLKYDYPRLTAILRTLRD